VGGFVGFFVGEMMGRFEYETINFKKIHGQKR
jgi:hypothetical protein